MTELISHQSALKILQKMLKLATFECIKMLTISCRISGAAALLVQLSVILRKFRQI